MCGKNKTIYEEGEGNFYFGSYPQTLVKDDGSGLVQTLRMISGVPTLINGSYILGGWTNYHYYQGVYPHASDDPADPTRGCYELDTEYMWYIDIEYGGNKYRGVYFVEYRPMETLSYNATPTRKDRLDAACSYQDNNGYYKENLYWFKWEPISWSLLDTNNGYGLLLSNVMLDSREMQAYIGGYFVWGNSGLRNFLSNTFFNSAFTSTEKSFILPTTVQNNKETTANPNRNRNESGPTNEQVFLLSYQDTINYKLAESGRKWYATDYAKCQGSSCSVWWTRSPGDAMKGYSCAVMGTNGEFCGFSSLISTGVGIVPAVWIGL